MKPLVVALGGNALLRKGQRETPRDLWETIHETARKLKPIIEEKREIVLTHGNGPQVGLILEAFSYLPETRPHPSLDMMVAMTQGWLGYMIQHAIEAVTATRFLVVPTRVKVSKRDPAFANPTKFVGVFYTEEEAKRLSRERGWIMKPDPRGGWRRVVPSPVPLEILEAPLIKQLVTTTPLIAVGGGGIPVDEGMKPVEAVVDKDLASSLLARTIDAEALIILTDVRGVAINYRKPGEKWLTRVSVRELEEYYERGEFPPGSMGPKVKAVIEFVKTTGRRAAIGSLDEAYLVYKGVSGTQVYP